MSGFLRWCPGALGLYLRQKWYPGLVASCGRKALFGRYVDLLRPERIVIGDNVVISNNVLLDASQYVGSGPAITLQSGCFVGEGVTLKPRGGRICIGPGSSLGSFCRFDAPGEIIVGRKVLFAAYSRAGLLPEGELHSCPGQRAGKVTGDINVEDGCWLGVRSELTPSARVGEGSIVGAHSVVTGQLPPFCIAVGRPATILRMRTPVGRSSAPGENP